MFVAIDPGGEVAGEIAAAIGTLAAKAPRAKWVKADNLHVTLAFLGYRDDAEVPAIGEALGRAAAGHAPFELSFRGGGVFGRGKRPRVLWAGCEGDLEALGALYRDVVGALGAFGFVPDRPEFEAHLTLARARDPGGDRGLTDCMQALAGRDFGRARIEEVRLYESRLSPRGPEYRVVAAARLAGGAADVP